MTADLAVNVCFLRNPHDPHDWWYTSEGGGHMVSESAGERQHHCPGVLPTPPTPAPADLRVVLAEMREGRWKPDPVKAPWVEVRTSDNPDVSALLDAVEAVLGLADRWDSGPTDCARDIRRAITDALGGTS